MVRDDEGAPPVVTGIYTGSEPVCVWCECRIDGAVALPLGPGSPMHERCRDRFHQEFDDVPVHE
jgi:hypothetical protein